MSANRRWANLDSCSLLKELVERSWRSVSSSFCLLQKSGSLPFVLTPTSSSSLFARNTVFPSGLEQKTRLPVDWPPCFCALNAMLSSKNAVKSNAWKYLIEVHCLFDCLGFKNFHGYDTRYLSMCCCRCQSIGVE